MHVIFVDVIVGVCMFLCVDCVCMYCLCVWIVCVCIFCVHAGVVGRLVA